MSNSTIRIGTRGSKLALIQAKFFQALLHAKFPHLNSEIVIIKTTGDRRLDVPLAQVAKASGIIDKGVFIKELEFALENKEIDLAVHSLKDLPSELEPHFSLGAVLPRENPQDVIVSRHGYNENALPHGTFLLNNSSKGKQSGIIGTSSVRRARQLRYLCPDVQIIDWRGNVPSRLEKLANAHLGADAIILARAGLNRLGFCDNEISINGIPLYISSLDPEKFVPAAAQGAIGIEILSENQFISQLLQELHDEATALCVNFERYLLKNLGANCSTPVGVWATLNDKTIHCHFRLFAENTDILNPSIDISWNQPIGTTPQIPH